MKSWKMIIIAFYAMFCSADLSAQATGYRGKQFALKTDIISGVRLLRFGVDVEYAFARMASINLALKGEQYHNDESFSGPDNYYGSLNPTQLATASLGLRFYPDKIIPAPQGFYFNFEAGLGMERHTAGLKTTRSGEVEKVAKRASLFFKSSVPSIGYQTTLGRRFLLDFNYATEIFYTAYDSQFDYKYLSSNLISAQFQNFVFGPAFYVKFGVLLF